MQSDPAKSLLVLICKADQLSLLKQNKQYKTRDGTLKTILGVILKKSLNLPGASCVLDCRMQKLACSGIAKIYDSTINKA